MIRARAHRLRQLATDARIGLSVVGRLFAERKARELDVPALRETLRRLGVIGSALSENKSVRFRGRIFTDGYSPPWPDPAFFDMVTAFGTDRPFCAYAVFAITAKCMFRCEHCYAINALSSKEVLPREVLLETVEALCRSGVGVLSLEGGEPMLRYADLLAALRQIDGRATPFIATTGWGLDAKKAAELAEAGLVAAQISLDHYVPEKHNDFRGNPKAFDTAARAVSLHREAGVFPILAVCATRDVLRDGGLFRYLELAKELGAGMIQVIDPLPAGNYLGAKDAILSRAELDEVIDFHRVANTDPRYDGYPAVCARAHVEHESRFGCGMGGNTMLYVDASGNVQPCVYTPMAAGNVRDEDLATILERMRSIFPKSVDGLCPVYALAKPIASELAKEGASNPLGLEITRRLAKKLMQRGEPEVARRMRKKRRLPPLGSR